MDTSDNFFTDKTILVTGGAGSIGKELVRKLLHTDIKALRVLDNNETGLHDVAMDMDDSRIRLFLGDITNEKRLIRAMENVDIVYHAAALKHVPICEYNPFEAAETNVRGTQNCIDAAIVNKVQKMIFISTDKAVSPYNVMGATKLVAERLIIAANMYSKHTRFACVRFGNVINSRGSVIPLFKRQILQGGPVTITDPHMTRFIMTISQAVDLIIKCSLESDNAEIYVLKMPAVNISDLARSMIKYCHDTYKTPENIDLKIIGIRPGEKVFEELLSKDELGKLEDKGEYFVIRQSESTQSSFISFSYSSNICQLLTQDQIEEILHTIKI